MIRTLASVLLLISIVLPASAEQRSFDQCISDWQYQASQKELPDNIVNDVIPGLKHLPKVITYDRRQPEFTQTFARYLNRRLTDARIDRGSDLYESKKPLLDKLTKQYGVPGRYLVAFWGLETNFGGYLGKMPILDSLATLACDKRRSDFFTEELFIALKLMHRENLTTSQMHGSWAGAMGHTQFMPSTFAGYAVDGDGDGQINLWQSETDALTSAANFLSQLGWKKEQRWGREVILPDDFPFEESGYRNKQALSYWSELGVTTIHGNPLPDMDLKSAILVPAGHTGPAFVVYPNFEVIMRWNRSEYYALSVGLLADTFAGAVSLHNPPDANEKALSKTDMKNIQHKLNKLGFDAGKPDGIMGSNTRNALREFQKSAGLIADGYPNSSTLTRLIN